MDQSLIDALLQPATYPERPSGVCLVQTHISYLFLTDRYVYKVKKPVDFGFLDFTTLEKRRFYCSEEVRLNRRLSPDIYLGVVALHRDQDGSVSLDGKGEIVDYAVKMIRLPQQRMMARLLDEGAVTAGEIAAIARTVAAFHATADRSSEIDRYGSTEMIRANWEENLRQVRPFCERTLTARTLAQIESWVMAFLQNHEPHFAARIAAGFIRECDGDLHSENICLDDAVHIFDCIEFNEKFRYSDTVADVAFLVMDMESHGRADLSRLFVREYIAASGDGGLRDLLPLYLVNRAFIRGKVTSFRLDDPQIPATEKPAAAAKAARYFRLARGYTLRERLPFSLIVTCGFTGCGKSSLAAELALQLGLEHLASDVERKRLAGIAAHERGADIYTPEWNRRTYAQLARRADEVLARGERVIVDGTFLRRADRQTFSALAEAAGGRLLILRLHCPADRIRQRLAARAQDPTAVSDGTWEIYQQQAAVIEEPTAAEGELIHLDATVSPAQLADRLYESLGIG